MLAHYVFIIDSRKEVRLGDLNISSIHDDISVESRKINQTLFHPKYKFPNSYFDVAVIIMDRPINFTNFIRPICS